MQLDLVASNGVIDAELLPEREAGATWLKGEVGLERVPNLEMAEDMVVGQVSVVDGVGQVSGRGEARRGPPRAKNTRELARPPMVPGATKLR